MKVPQEEIDKMLADGRTGEITSMLLLAAAIAIKKGIPPEVTRICDPVSGERLPADLEDALKKAHADGVANFQKAAATEIDHAIALYTAHLNAAGYSIEAGYDN